MPEITWTNVVVTLGELVPWDHNPKDITEGNARRLLDYWKKIGQFQTIAIGPNNEVYDGHQRLTVLLAAFGPNYEVDARQSSRPLTEQERKELVIAAHAGTTGHWDWKALKEWDAVKLRDWGFDKPLLEQLTKDAAHLSKMLDSQEEQEPTPPREDEAEALREKWGVEVGQLWQLWDHLVVCGDATDSGQVTQLMGGERADMVFIDPPYLMEYEGPMRKGGYHGQRHSMMIGDNMSRDEGDLFLSQMAAIIKRHCRGAFYICFHRLKLDRLMNALSANDLRWRAVIVWYKGSLNLSGADYKSAYEPIIYGWNQDHVWHGTLGEMDVIELSAVAKEGGDEVVTVSGHSAIFRIGGQCYMIQRLEDTPTAFIDGGDSVRFAFYNEQESDVWEVRKSAVNDLHPTMKPVEVVRRAITNSSAQGDAVADWFCGSGTTMVTCEQEGRLAYGMELDPKYVAVTLDRLSGMDLEPTLVSG